MCIYMSRGGNAYLLDYQIYVHAVPQRLAHNARMRCALVGSALEVCALVLRISPHAGATVRDPAPCGRLRDGDPGGLCE
jgi:hypothetical protein